MLCNFKTFPFNIFGWSLKYSSKSFSPKLSSFINLSIKSFISFHSFIFIFWKKYFSFKLKLGSNGSGTLSLSSVLSLVFPAFGFALNTWGFSPESFSGLLFVCFIVSSILFSLSFWLNLFSSSSSLTKSISPWKESFDFSSSISIFL